MAEQAPFYVFAAFIFTYGTTVLHSSRDLLLTALLVATGLSAVTIPLSGYISDRIGRKRMYLIGAVAMGLFGLRLFRDAEHDDPGGIFLAIVLSFIPHDMMYGPQAALIAECFSPRLRYSGASLGFHLVVGHRRRAGAADRDRAARRDRLGLFGRDLYPGLRDRQRVATAFLPDYTNQDISQEAAYGELADPDVEGSLARRASG